MGYPSINTANCGGGIAVNGADKLTQMEDGTILETRHHLALNRINDYLLSNDHGFFDTWRRISLLRVTINNGTITGNKAVLTGHKVNNDHMQRTA